jgi:type I restriction enzyme M protein
MYLPRPIEKKLPITATTLLDVMEILAPIKIIASNQEVVQTFYMHFAKHLYKWDLAQFFTPVTVSDFIATVLNPSFGEHIKDPACGSADFLTSAFRLGSQVDHNYAQCVWGADNSANAVQVAVLNMLLNGDGKSNIELEDSLERVANDADRYDMMICNPPFGTRIVEARREVLRQFDMGHQWELDAKGVLQKTGLVRDRQQVGILFAELCVRQAKPGGRIAIILPNGYLGNKGVAYRALREWLLRHCRVASICGFPRFTFKTSGADVSASVVFLEKRKRPLKSATSDKRYDLHVGLIESVGWQLGDKGAKPVYQRDPADGGYIHDESGSKVLDADFARILDEIRLSAAARRFKWMAGGPMRRRPPTGWTVPITRIADEPTLCMDPKRLCRKATELRERIASQKHYRLGDLLESIPEPGGRWLDTEVYRYVELQDIGVGGYQWTALRGWQLPDRARHPADRGDLFVGSVWGSVQKWMMAGGDTTNLLVTNGCHRLKLRPGKERYFIDIVAALSTEAYATQMRSLARGSDGLAEVGADELADVLIPAVTSRKARAEIEPFVDQLLKGHTTVRATVDDLLASGTLNSVGPERRSHHTVLV